MNNIEQQRNENSNNNHGSQSSDNEAKYNWGIGSGILGLMISLGMGFYKMFVYTNNNDEDSYISDATDSVNAYVGGDAYNYIINASYSTGYFILALVSMVFLCTMLILKRLDK
ncbi:hypothetical protein [Rummeliibacillus pycnus]|uniref:hypothetical protein n=1 Tax=Rummeliibacillus pycnus TaxID=101070 RepID=UPI001B805820|nr:hypothetical protein [Rummeliibacillus pycnus]